MQCTEVLGDEGLCTPGEDVVDMVLPEQVGGLSSKCVDNFSTVRFHGYMVLVAYEFGDAETVRYQGAVNNINI